MSFFHNTRVYQPLQYARIWPLFAPQLGEVVPFKGDGDITLHTHLMELIRDCPMNAVFRKLSGATFAALALGLASQVTHAQDADEAAADLGKVTITGSRIKRVDLEGPSPVVVITAEQMEKRGFANVSEVLDSLVQNTGGTSDQSFTFGFIPATSAPDIRGFGQNASLVLLDGRRIPVYPIPQSGTSNIVDFASIPTVQVDRIEILTDGASAIYGSDAIAGVINIITRKDYDGVNVNLRTGDTSNGGYATDRVQVFAGTGSGDTRITTSFEYWANDPIMASERDYAGSDIANPSGAFSVGGASFVDDNSGEVTQAPGCGTPAGPLGGLGIPDINTPIFTSGDMWCSFNRTAFRQLFAEQKRTSASLRIDHDITDNLSAFARVSFTDQKTNTQLEPLFFGGALFGTTPATANVITPQTAPAWGYVVAGASNNPLNNTTGAPGWFVRRLIEYGPRATDFQNNGLGALVGLSGSFGSRNIYEWDVAVGYNKTDLVVERANIISSTFNELVSNGLDLFQPIPQSVVDSTRFLSTRDAESTNSTVDATLRGDTGLEIQGRPVAFAVHSDFTSEDFINTADAITLNGDAFDGGSEGSGERDHWGVGFEFGIPVLDQVNISAAIRYDEYSDASIVSDAVSPKIGIEWRPLDNLLVRGSWGESFRAPDMQRLFGATTRAFRTVNDPVTGLQVQAVQILSGSNPGLVPEEGTNYSIGAVYEPIQDLTLSLDYIVIELEQIVTTLNIQNILNICGPLQDGPTCGQITRDAQGTLQGGFISQQAANLALQNYEGIDFSGRYRWETARAGTFIPELSFAYVQSIELQSTSASPVTEQTGLVQLPEWRINANLGYEIGDFSANLFVTWVDEMCGVNGGTAQPGCIASEFIDSYTLVNLSAAYDFGNLGAVTFGLNNVFDEDPAEDPTNDQWPWFFNNGGFSNPIGREWTLAYNKEF
jgi:iron complex outermembrane receptor protein